MSKWRTWWREHDGLIGMVSVAGGMFALGAMLATVHFERQLSMQRTRHALEIGVLVDNYSETLKAKDQLIANLAKQTKHAAQTANHAAVTANRAARENKRQHKLDRWTK